MSRLEWQYRLMDSGPGDGGARVTGRQGLPALVARRGAVCALLALALGALLSYRLDRPALHTDELTYMGKIAESLSQGSLLPVHSNGELFVNKPPLALWLMRLSFLALEPSVFAARLPSVLATVATGLVLYLFAASAFGEMVAIAAALLFALVPGPLTLHGLRSATPDALEIFFVTSAIVCLELWRRRRWRWARAGLVAAAALGAWVKSPFALLFVLAYLLSTESLARRAGLGTPRFRSTLVLVAAAGLGSFLLWLGAAKAFGPPGSVSHTLIDQQYLKRLKGTLARTHVQGAGFYWRGVAEDFGPWLLLPAAAFVVALRHPSNHPVRRHDGACLLSWSLAAPVLASLSASKLPWYVYLSYPGIAMVLARSAWRLAALLRWGWARISLLATIIGLFAARLPAAEIWPREPRHPGRLVLLLEAASQEPALRLRLTDDLRFGHSDRSREARFYVRSLLWTLSRRPRMTRMCSVVLSNEPHPPSVEVLAPERSSRGLYLLDPDSCAAGLRQRLADPRLD